MADRFRPDAALLPLLPFGTVGVEPDYCPRCVGPCLRKPPCHVEAAFNLPDFTGLEPDPESDEIEGISRHFCRERCAEYGDPPCFEVDSEGFYPCDMCIHLTGMTVEQLRAEGRSLRDAKISL